MRKDKGVSMISLVITIIVILILAAITFHSVDTIDKASEERAMQELSEVKKGMLTVRAINAKQGIDETTLNKNFIRVKVADAPDNFVSYANNEGEDVGYVVDLSVIDYEKVNSGQDYKNFSSGDTITFKTDDVFVYDAELKVFNAKSGRYLEGYQNEQNNTTDRKDGPDINVIYNKDGKLEFEVSPKYGGEIISVIIDGQKVNLNDNNLYDYIEKTPTKDKVTIIASEKDGGTTTKVIPIDVGDENRDNDINSPSIISYECEYKQGTADVTVIAQDENARIMAYAVVVGEDSTPSEWIDISEPANMYTIKFNVTENGVYKVFVRNSFGKTASSSKNIRVILNVRYKYDANGGESINAPEVVQLGCNMPVDLTPKVTRKHYEFLGWNTKVTATEGMTEYNIGIENDLVLYPIFRPKVKLVKPTIAVPKYTYNGKEQTLQLNDFDGTLLGITENTMIDAGTKTAVITILNKDRYEWADGTDDNIEFTWTIDKKKISVVWGTTRTFIYNIDEQAPTVSVDSGVEGETVEISRTTAINVGNYTSTASMVRVVGGQANLDNYILENTTMAYRINPYNLSNATIGDISSYTYDGNSKLPTPAVTVPLKSTTTLVNGTEFTYSYSNNLNAGTATVTATGKGNYTGTKSKKYTISKRAITVTAGTSSKTYDGTALTNTTVTLTSGTLGTGDVMSASASGRLINAGSTTNSVSSVVIRRSGTDVTGNYTITKVNGTLTINKRSISANWSTTVAFVYNGQNQAPTVSASSGVNGETIVLTKTTGKNKGSYTSTASISGVNGGQANKNNYTLTNTTKAFSISARAVNVTWGSTQFAYDGGSHVPSASANSGVTGETINLSINGAQINPGVYNATASISSVSGGQGDKNNYTLNNTTVSFTILKNLQVGDYVNYTPTYASASIDTGHTGGSGGSLSTESKAWRIISIVNGKILVTTNGAVSVNSIEMRGKAGFIYGPDEVNRLCKALYSSSKITARSLTVEDIDTACNYNPSGWTWDYKIYYGQTMYFSSGLFYSYEENGRTVVSADGKWNDATVKQTAHNYNAYSYNQTVGDILGSNDGWLASRHILLLADRDYASYGLRKARGESVDGYMMTSSRNNSDDDKGTTAGLHPAFEISITQINTDASISNRGQSQSQAWNISY